MKFLSVLYISLFLLPNPILSETIPAKLDILKKSNECFNFPKKQVCKKLILQLEKIQLFEFERNRFKCQTSILGLQTELIEAHFFDKIPKQSNGIMAPYVFKNC